MRWRGKNRWARTLEQHPVLSKSAAGALTFAAALVLVQLNGIGAGIFSLAVIVMGMGSLLVVLFPFRYLNAFSVMLFYLAALACEYFIA